MMESQSTQIGCTQTHGLTRVRKALWGCVDPTQNHSARAHPISFETAATICCEERQDG